MANPGGAPPVGQENINTDIITLTRFFTEEQVKVPEATGDFTYVSLQVQRQLQQCTGVMKLTRGSLP